MLKTNKDWKHHFQHMAIAKRITLLYGGIFSATLLFLSVLLTLNMSTLHQSTLRRELADTAKEVQALLKKQELISDESLEELLKHRYVDATVFSYRENKLYSSNIRPLPLFILPPEIRPNAKKDTFYAMEEQEAFEKKESYLHEREKKLRQNGYQINIRRESRNGQLEYLLENEKKQRFMLLTDYVQTETDFYRVQVFKMMDGNEYWLKHFITKLLLADAVGIFSSFLIGLYISRRIFQPVEDIRFAAERISIEDLSRRIDTTGPEDEMKELKVTFNSMIDRLETSFQKQNQFISDASHELRTPISVIQGYANLVNRWGKSDPEILQESIDSILTETEHMSALIRQLLFLAKSDQNKLNAQKQPIFLNEVVAELMREAEVLNTGRNIVLTEEAKVEIYADYDLIKQLLWIHGENAIKYSEAGGVIEVRIWKDKKYGYLSVRDYGVGIAEEDLPKIFDRFYRVDKSRNKEIAGTGLGLSIARWIIECHEGKILVESKLGEGTMFTDQFPLYEHRQEEI